MEPGRPTKALTIGNFDGVHVGHVALVRRARELAADGSVVVMCFDPHPASVLRPGAEPPRLTSYEDRVACLRAAGAGEVIRLEPSHELLGLSPEEFVRDQIVPLGITDIVEGGDFRFGRARSGTVETLRVLGSAFGFGVETIGPIEVTLGDHTMVRASSSILRWLMERGRVQDAARVLGRPFTLAGLVERGDRRGRTIGFPTANVRTDQVLPADGVYAGRARLDDGRVFVAAVSVGTKPTYGESRRTLEAFLLDAPTNRRGDATCIAGTPEYGWNVRIELLGWIRAQLAFSGTDELVEQMKRDCELIRKSVRVWDEVGLTEEVSGCA